MRIKRTLLATLVVAAAFLAGCSTITTHLTSSPPGAVISHGPDESNLKPSKLVTPAKQSATLPGPYWKPWCYKAELPGHAPKTICKEQETGDRFVHFDLQPIQQGASQYLRTFITSNPSGASLLWGPDRTTLTPLEGVTPKTQSIDTKTGPKLWIKWCYGASLPGYKSQVICKEEETGDRTVHFNLEPTGQTTKIVIKTIITSSPDGASISWGPDATSLKPMNATTPKTIAVEAKIPDSRLNTWCFRADLPGYKSKIICKDPEPGDRYVYFKLEPIEHYPATTTRPKKDPAPSPPPPRKAQVPPAAGVEPPPLHAQPKEKEPKLKGTGTGFIVSEQGHVLTNYHVIARAKQIRVPGLSEALGVVAVDKENDLALLKMPPGVYTPAKFRTKSLLRPGDNIVVVGFPLQGLLASTPSVTTGAVSAMAGLRNDRRLIQISAPVQPGNSGGPVMDEAGNVAAVVASKLDALKVAKITGDIPQNVNFAINGVIARVFMDANGVKAQASSSATTMKTADIFQQASQFVVLILVYN